MGVAGYKIDLLAQNTATCCGNRGRFTADSQGIKHTAAAFVQMLDRKTVSTQLIRAFVSISAGLRNVEAEHYRVACWGVGVGVGIGNKEKRRCEGCGASNTNLERLTAVQV